MSANDFVLHLQDILGALIVVVGLVVELARRARQARVELEKTRSALESVVRGVERGTRRMEPDQAKALKREIQTETMQAGSELEVSRHVQRLQQEAKGGES